MLVMSSKAGDRFSYETGNFTESVSKVYLEIDQFSKFQKIRGFGGGYTGSVTHLVDKLSPNMQKCFYNSYFSGTIGMGYSYLRIPIGGTDFDLKAWAYNEYPENDANLSNFTKLDERDLLRNKQLKQLAKISMNENVKYLAAAWTPPKWMKALNLRIGLPINQIKSKFYQTWADYHLKWLDLMDKANISFYAISTGNEPHAAFLNFLFPEMYWNPDNHAKWIAENFLPTIRNSKFSNIQIHGFDDSRLFAKRWFDAMEKSKQNPLEHITAIDFHGYTDFLSPTILDNIHVKFPAKEIWYTEISFGMKYVDLLMGGPRLGLWDRCEKLAKRLIETLNHSTVG